MWPVVAPGRILQPGWYLDAICCHLEYVLAKQIRRLMILIPPGCLKSVTACVLFPAWCWYKQPHLQFLFATNSENNAITHSLACRNLIESEVYQRYFTAMPNGETWKLRDDRNTVKWFDNTQGGRRQITYSPGGTVTGKKADILGSDDLMDASQAKFEAYRRNSFDWYDNAYGNRINDYKESGEFMIGQKLRKDDIQAHAFKQGGWVVLRLPERRDDKPCYIQVSGFIDPREEGEYLRPERFGPEEEEKERKRLGIHYEAQHQQNPQDRSGRMFPRSKVQILPAIPYGLRCIRYWDLASSPKENACYTSGVLLGKDSQSRIIIAHAVRDRLMPHDRNNLMRNTALGDQYRQGIAFVRQVFEKQPGAAGIDQYDDIIRFMAGLPIEGVLASGDKFDRAEPFASQWNAGSVFLVDDGTGWHEWYLDAMEAFGRDAPANELDTGDASSGAFNRMEENYGNGPPAAGKNPEIARMDALGIFKQRRF